MESLRPRRIGEIIQIIWKKKRLLALMTLAMLLATFFVIRRIPSRYESSSTIVIGKQTSDLQRVQQAPRFSALIDQLNSRDTIGVIVRKYNLYPEIGRFDAKIGTFQKDLKDLKLSTKIRDYYPQVPESVKIYYRHTDPVKAQQVVAELTGAFTTANAELRMESSKEAQRLAGKIVEVEAELQKLGPKKDLQTLRFEMLARQQDPAAALGAATQRAAMEGSIESLKDDKFRLETAISQKKTEIEDQKKIVKQASLVPNAAVSTATGTLLANKAQLEAKINANTAKGFKTKHPEMVALNNELTQLEQQIARMESSPTQNGEANKVLLPEYRDLRKMQGELTSMEAQLEATNRKLNTKSNALQKLPSAPLPSAQEKSAGDPGQNAAVGTAYDKLLTKYEWLLKEQDNLIKTATESNSEIMYQVVEQPNLPQFPVTPNKLLLKILALMLAFGFGLLVAFGSELPRFFLINDERDISYYLGAPVLAAIPETLTPIERSHNRKLKMTRGLLMMVLVGALVPAFVILLNISQIFHFLGNK